VLNLIAEASGLQGRLELPLHQGELVEAVASVALPEWRELLLGLRPAAVVGQAPTGAWPANSISRRRAVFPGAFNPLHAGHRQMAELATKRLGTAVEFEISIVNVDKPPLDFTEMHERAAQFSPGQTLWFTRAATFVEKAQLFPEATFIVGTDTILRIADPKYYGHPQARRQALKSIARQGCRFLVFSRAVDHQVRRLSQLPLPAELTALCDEVPPRTFREDISSTQLRATRKAGS
jgi:nicotinic acid mononucleotide adenylyltransferase